MAGVDIGGTNYTVAVARANGEVLACRRERLRAGGTARDVLDGVLALLVGMLREATGRTGRADAGEGAARGGVADTGTGEARTGDAGAAGAAHKTEPLLGIGVGFGGPVDVETGTVLTSHHVPGWDAFPLRETLKKRLGAPATIDNDANAAALGEARFGAARGHRHVLYVNVGTGIGAGVLLDGRLFHGAHGMAGEIGHVTVAPDGPEGPRCPCGKRGCLEAVASGRAIGRRAREAAGREAGAAGRLLALAGGDASGIEGPHVLTAASEGDPLAQRLVDETAAYLGLALGNAANVLDPSIIVVGGGVGEAGEVLFSPLRAAVRRHLLPSTPLPEVLPAALGYDAGIVGALALAFEGLSPR